MFDNEDINIQILSDLHCEIDRVGNLPDDNQFDLLDDSDFVVVAGDVHYARNVIKTLDKLFPTKLVIFVPGNHEYYYGGKSIDFLNDVMRKDAEEISKNRDKPILFLQNDEIILTIKNTPIRILGATLWVDFDLYGHSAEHQKIAEDAFNDFPNIVSETYDEARWKGVPEGYKEIKKFLKAKELLRRHQESRQYLKKKLSEDFKDGPTIVVTHYLPSLKSVPQKFKQDPESAGFASNLDGLIEETKPTLWIHGHTHNNCEWKSDDNKTLITCNPAGYRVDWKLETGHNPNFNPREIVKLYQNYENNWCADIDTRSLERTLTIDKK